MASEPLRIAYFVEDTAQSGGVRVQLMQADALIARGHQVRLVTKGLPLTWRSSRAEWIYVDNFLDYDARDDDFVVGTFWVTVGPAASLDVGALTAIKPRWCGAAPTGPGVYTAQLRAHGGETEVAAELVDGRLEVTFTEPVRGVAPGQAIVLYDGTRVVGSATIASTVRTTAGVA